MADGSRTMTAELEADAAAAEAAREAKADVLERAASERTLPRAAAAPKRAKTSVKTQWAEFIVDVWITNFNCHRVRHLQEEPQPGEVAPVLLRHGHLRRGDRERRAAQACSATARTCGRRAPAWTSAWCSSSSAIALNWRSTMDLMLGRSLQLTLGAHGLPVTCYSINTGDHDNMVYLERSAHKWPLMPENFSFFLLEDGKPQFFRLRRDFIDIGGDYTLYNQHNQPVGYLDGKVFSIGGKWKGRVKIEYADPRLLMVLKLFCGMLIFNRDARRHMRALYHDVASGKYTPRLEKQEADLYMNPRRVR